MSDKGRRGRGEGGRRNTIGRGGLRSGKGGGRGEGGREGFEDTRDIIAIISRLFSTFSKRACLPTTRKPSGPYELLRYCWTVRAGAGQDKHAHDANGRAAQNTYYCGQDRVEFRVFDGGARIFRRLRVHIYIFIRYLTNIIQGVPRTHCPLRYLLRHR